ncbi:tonB dependent receptor family protein, partial [Escherichia coli 8.2524]
YGISDDKNNRYGILCPDLPALRAG